MNAFEIKKNVFLVLKNIAPEVEQEDIEVSEDLRAQVDLDSMDYLNFLTQLASKFNIKIPESDYSQIETLEKLLKYIDINQKNR